MFKKVMVAVSVLLLMVTLGVAKERIVVNSYMADPAPRAAFAELVEMFEDQHPEYEVVVNTFPHEDFKTLLRTWLVAPESADVMTWFAGERMQYFAAQGLLEPLDDLFVDDTFSDLFPSAFRTVCAYDDQVYFIPQSWYWWGMWYRLSIFEELDLTTPLTWSQFLNVCQELQDAGYIPISIGTKFLWTAAGWFDHLNLRVSGFDFHMDLMEGKVPYTDARVREAFEYWGQLVEKGYFLDNHAAYAWQEAATFLFTGEAAMYLMGQFIFDVAPEDVQDDIGFFRFPIIDGTVGVYEETPIDGFLMPANAKNKEGARVFLRFIAEQESQQFFAEDLGRLAANRHVPAPDEMAQDGLDMILASDGVAQFYDRDTNPEMASEGMERFVEFMMFPDRLDTILAELETVRARIF